MALSSLIHQLPCGKYSAGADGTILESSQQCECGPKGFNFFWGSMDLFFCLSESERESELYPEIGSQTRGNTQHGGFLLGRKLIEIVI